MYWNIKEIQASELAAWQETKSGQFRVIDVREMREIMAGTIAGAQPMPMATVPARLHELGRDETIVFVCRSGARSGQVCAFLQQQGFDNVYNLRGGMIAWAQSGLPATLPQAV
jgi:rhodanese-related sulfurtransferase